MWKRRAINFLTEEECDAIVTASKQKGTKQSGIFATRSGVEKGSDKRITRVSEFAHLKEDDLAHGLRDRLYTRVARLINMPVEVVHNMGPMAIAKYNEGGHYYVHLDSSLYASPQTPCCFQTRCSSEPGPDKQTKDCCRVCRYATVLHYLNDVEEGGETAFPLADLSSTEIQNIYTKVDWRNLTAHCHEAKVRVKPEKGKSILWYNHFVDEQGYLGPVNVRSYHGGCDVLKGTKWIATNWISTPPFSQRRVPSTYRPKPL